MAVVNESIQSIYRIFPDGGFKGTPMVVLAATSVKDVNFEFNGEFDGTRFSQKVLQVVSESVLPSTAGASPVVST